MKKIIFALFFGVGMLHVIQSGCDIGLYYGNGIMQDKDEPEAKELWQQEVRKLKREYPELSNSVLSAKTSYNSSYSNGVLVVAHSQGKLFA